MYRADFSQDFNHTAGDPDSSQSFKEHLIKHMNESEAPQISLISSLFFYLLSLSLFSLNWSLILTLFHCLTLSLHPLPDFKLFSLFHFL